MRKRIQNTKPDYFYDIRCTTHIINLAARDIIDHFTAKKDISSVFFNNQSFTVSITVSEQEDDFSDNTTNIILSNEEDTTLSSLLPEEESSVKGS